MDRQIQNLRPDYKRIFTDIINKKDPNLKEKCKAILSKVELTVLDILELNQWIFGNVNKENETNNQKFRSYKESDILHILHYQKVNNLNNIQVANHFKTSRNTISKWKKMFKMNVPNSKN